MNEKTKKRRKEINQEYQERVKPSGVFQVKNMANGKVLLGSSLNLEGPLNKHRFLLKIKSFKKIGTSWVLIDSPLKSLRWLRSGITRTSISRMN